jgi:hypothetical protein
MSLLSCTCTIRNVTAARDSVSSDAGCLLGDVSRVQLAVLLLAIFTDLLETKNHSLCPFRGRLCSVDGLSSADGHFVALSDWSRVLLAHQQSCHR